MKKMNNWNYTNKGLKRLRQEKSNALAPYVIDSIK